MNPSCADYGDCPVPTTLTNWVFHNTFFTWLVYAVIAIIVAILAGRLLWYIFVYCKRDFCVDCKKKRQRVRTTLYYKTDERPGKGTPLCPEHYDKRVIDAEPTYTCNVHELECEKRWNNCYVVHFCPQGCVYLPPGRYDLIIEKVKENSGSSGFSPLWYLLGFSVGLTVGSTTGAASHHFGC